jgi:PAS domain S-box-containing protein
VIREANHAVSALIGFARRYTIGKPLAGLVAPEGQHEFQTRLAQLQIADSNAVQEWDQALRPRRYDRALVAAVRVAPARDRTGRLVALRWMLRDVTAQRRAEAERRTLDQEAERRIGERTAQLESANRVASALIARQQTDLAASRVRFEWLSARTGEGVFSLSLEGELTAVNPAMARLLGQPSPEALLTWQRRSMGWFINPGRHGELFRRLLHDESLTGVEVETARADGSRIRLMVDLWAVRDGTGSPTAIEGLARPAR